MYHRRFKKSHFEAGHHWGRFLLDRGKRISGNPTFEMTENRIKFARECLPFYEKFYPEVLDEIRGLAEGQKDSYEKFLTFLLSMYCFEFRNHCTCIARKKGSDIIFGRNSDFLVSLEKLNMNCLYNLDQAYAFNGNTTAFIEMEDGVNEHGFAVGLTFVYPTIIKPGINAGMLVRLLLEKCRTVEEAIELLHTVPIASQQTLTMADKSGTIAVVECNCKEIDVKKYKDDDSYVVATNEFFSEKLRKYNNYEVDSWRAEERYKVADKALKENRILDSFELIQNILSGKYGFMCQYDRKTNADTVWSVIYDLGKSKIFRAEGNPQRKSFFIDRR